VEDIRKIILFVLTTLFDLRKFELDNLHIQYKEPAITNMKQLTKNHKVVLIFAPGKSTALTNAKIYQMLSTTKYFILDL